MTLTESQQRVLRLLTEHEEAHGFSLSLDLIARAGGMSAGFVNQVLGQLQDKGLIKRRYSSYEVVRPKKPTPPNAPTIHPLVGDNIRTAPDAQHLVAPILSLFAQRGADALAS